MWADHWWRPGLHLVHADSGPASGDCPRGDCPRGDSQPQSAHPRAGPARWEDQGQEGWWWRGRGKAPCCMIQWHLPVFVKYRFSIFMVLLWHLNINGAQASTNYYYYYTSLLTLFFCFPQEEEGQGGDQDQEERRWNKRTQQMLHGLQVLCRDFALI